MINVSNAFKEELKNDNRNYFCYVDIELNTPNTLDADLQDTAGEYILDTENSRIETKIEENTLHLQNENLWSGGISIEESVSNDTSFDVGSTIINKATVVINNIYENYSEYDFTGAKVTIKVGLNLSGGTTEMVNKGIFYVDEAKYNGGILTLECLDSMSRFDKDYDTTLQFPATLQQIIQDACTNCGVLYSAAGFSGSDYIIQSKPDTSSLTYRQVLSYVGQIACQQFSIDHNDRLVARWYDLTMMDSLHNNSSSVDESDYHHISSISTSNIDMDDVVITGVRVTEYSEDSENPGGVYTAGSDGYIIEIKDNRLIAVGSGNTVASMIGDRLIGARFRPMTISFQSDPTIEPTDIAEIIDYKGNHYYTFVTHTSFTIGSLQTLKCSAKSALRNSASRYSSATQAYNSSRVLIEKERTQREAAIQALNNALENSSGMYITEEQQPDGSTITYLHDKPTLADSQNIIKITAEAIGISNDGGATYPYGLFLTGDLIARLLYVVGINADYINAGAIHVEDNDGNIVFHVDMDTKQVIISGDSVRIGSKTATTAISDAIQESKDYSDGKLADFADTVTEDLTNIQAQVDGQIETYYEDYEPSLQNYPANEWTTTEERKKHEGDLFYWKSKGYAYRFFQDGATWKWQLVQDTDITQAMAAAEQAQDTADGKRRVFVVTPQPPYDIGDLWCNGEDILTCSTARAQGSVYVSTDWTKLNTYTDDTVANQALEEARQARNLNMILDNEYQGIPADYEGNISSFPAVKTGVQVLYGHTDVSANCSYSTTKSDSITGNWNNTLRVYTVTGLSADTGWVDITASYLTLFTVTKRFNVQKIRDGSPGSTGPQGPPGANGQDGKVYILEASDTIVKIIENQVMSPDVLEFNAYYQEGSRARQAYAGRFRIEESTDGQSWTTIYQSSADESYVKRYLYGVITNAAGNAITNASGRAIGTVRNFTDVRVTLYAAGGFSTIIDRVTIPVITAVESLNQRDIFNLLTNNGLAKGIYMVGNELYINATYLVTGVLTDLLGKNFWNLDTGEFSLSPTTTVGGETVQEIADGAAGNAVSNMSQTDVFNKLTNNGTLPGIFMRDGQLYINANYIGAGTLLADYIKGGTLTLGGSNNTNGILQILNASGQQIGKWDKDGISASNANISGNVEAQTGKIGELFLENGSLTNGIPFTEGKDSWSTGMGSCGGYKNGDMAFWAGNGRFMVWQTGSVYCEDIAATGYINATSGTFTGTVNANDGVFNGTVNANDGVFNGTVNADSGVFNNITVQNSSVYSSYMAGTAGTISGGTYSDPYISGGTIGRSGGTYVGTCSGSTLSSCSIGSTALGSRNGYIQADTVGVNIHSSGGVLLWRGSLNAGYTSAGWQVAGNMYCSGNLSCGGSKPRTMRTKNFGERQLDAMESAEPAFSDFGKAVLNENGEFYIFLDPILAECVSPDSIPLVFLTKYGQGDIWVDDERTNHEVAVICGTPGLKFTWETRYMQGNGYQDRLRIRDFDDPYITDEDYLGDTNSEIAQNTLDYESMADDYATVCNAEAESYAVAGYVYFTQYESQAKNYAAIGAKYYEDFERSLLGI